MSNSDLIAILLVTSTNRGDSNLVFHYPPVPAPSLRYSRPHPRGIRTSTANTQQDFEESINESWADSSWRSAQDMNDSEVGNALKKMVTHGKSNDAMPGAAGTGVDGDGDGDCIWRRAPNPIHSNLSSDEEQFGAGSRIGLAGTHRRGMGRRLNQSGQRSQPDSGRGTPATANSNSTPGTHSSSHSGVHHTHSHSLSNPSSHSTAPKPTFKRSVSIQAHSHVMNGVNRNCDAQNSHHLPSPSPSLHTAGFPPAVSNPMARSVSHSIPNSSSTSSSASASNSKPHPDSTKPSAESHAPTSKSKAPKSPSPLEGGPICSAYNNLLGYSTSFLANLLSPKPALCHQKFELIVDELVFVGHPVCVDADGGWGFEETYKSHNEERGKETSMGGDKLSGGVAVTPDDTPDVSPNPSGGPSNAAAVYPSSSTCRVEARGRQIGRDGSSASITAIPKALPLYPEPKSGSVADTIDLELDANAGDDEHDDSPSLSVSRARTRSTTSYNHTHSTSISAKTPPFSPRNSHKHSGQGQAQGTGGKGAPSRKGSSQLTSFHLVFVLDRPDSTSATSSDLPKFIDIFYRQIGFKLTAALHHEQGRAGYVDAQSSILFHLREKCIDQREPFMTFVDKAVEASPLANAMKTAYLSVLNASIAHVMISSIPLDIQLPLNHPLLNKHHPPAGIPCEDADDDSYNLEGEENDRASYGGRWGVDEWEEKEANMWDEEMRYAFKIQPLKPWKTILLLENELELAAVAVAAGVGGEAEGEAGLGEFMSMPPAARKEGEKIHPLRKFLAFLSENVTLSLADIATLTELDLQNEIYPLARALVYSRKAKVIDAIGPGLKNMYVPLRNSRPLKDLSVSFARKFPTVSPLPTLLSALSSAPRPFSTLIPTHDHRPLFTDVLIWLLKRDLVQMLHMRVRLFVSREIKKTVREKRKREREERKRDREVKEARRQEGKTKGKAAPRLEKRRSDAGLGGYTYPSVRPGVSPSTSRESSRDAAIKTKKKNPLKKRGRHSLDNAPTVSRSYDPRGKSIGLDGYNSDEESGGDGGYDADVREALARRREREREDWGEADEDVTPSFITEPGRATKLERKWMEAMMGQVGRMDDRSNYWFERICPYFDGKTTMEEIRYRTDITRRDLRDVLRKFDPFLMIFVHP